MKRALVPLLLALAAPASTQRRAVQVTRPARADLTEVVSLVGTLEPLLAATLVPRVTGYLASVSVDVGDVVVRDAELARISAPDLDAELAAAQARAAQAAAGVALAQAGVASAQGVLAERRAREAAARALIARREQEVALEHAVVGLARRELERLRRLHEDGTASLEELEAKQGEVEVARLRLKAVEAAHDQAQADAQSAAADSTSAQAGIAAAQAGVDAARAAVGSAAADVQRVEALRGFQVLGCPFERAVVTARYVHPGAHVSADEGALLVLMDVSKVRVVLMTPEREAARIAPGKPIEITFQAEGVAPRRATITRASGALDPASRTRRTEVELENPGGELLPGMFVMGRVTVRESKGALTLPGDAIRTADDHAFVWVVRGGVLVAQPVTLGLDDGLRAEIVAGLAGDEQVVVGSASGLRAGMAVEAREAAQ